MDLLELESFVAVADTGSMASASARLGVPRATLARRLDALEARAGVPLVRRNVRGATLTDAGERLLRRARELLASASAILADVATPTTLTGTVRVLLTVGMPPAALAQIYGSLRMMFPGLDYAHDESSDPLSRRLEGYDLVIHWDGGPGRPDWSTEPLAHARVWLIASPGYLDRCGRPTSAEDLAGHSLLAWRRPGAPADRWPLLTGGELVVAPRLVCSNPHLLRHLARAGEGIALVPDVELPEPDVGPERFEVVLPDEVGAVVTLSVSGPSHVLALPRVAAVLAAARSLTSTL